MKTTSPKTPIGAQTASREWLNTVLERTCRDFAGRVTQQHVLDVIREIASNYRDARVVSYVPIMVSRYARERLQRELDRDSVR
jgi:hypothetical protein